MSKEAMKLALEALLVHEYELRKVGQSFKVEPAIKALEEALAKQEQGEHKESVRLECVVCNTVYADGVPPQVAKQEQGEPAAKYIGEDWSGSLVSLYDDIPLNTLLYTTPQPAQKPWVGLTDADKQTAVWSEGSFGSGALWAEAKLKEKNT